MTLTGNFTKKKSTKFRFAISSFVQIGRVFWERTEGHHETNGSFPIFKKNASFSYKFYCSKELKKSLRNAREP